MFITKMRLSRRTFLRGAGVTQALHQRIGVAVVLGKLVFQREGVFHESFLG